jgi:hypothetical protein
MTTVPFDLTREEQGTVLLCLALSAVCVYLPCRWRYVPVSTPDVASCQRYLPYIYCLLGITIPMQIVKNYLYLRYIQENGGYLAFFRTTIASRAVYRFPYAC